MEDENINKPSVVLGYHEYSLVEKCVMWVALLIVCGVMAGFVLAFDTFWVEWLKPLTWDPIVKDAGTSGDAGYSPQNTAIYTSTLLFCVVLFQALFRKWNIPYGRNMTLALIAWVCLAPVLRVLEDADFFRPSVDVFLISPIIHIALAVQLIVVAVSSHFFAGNLDGRSNDAAEHTQRTTLFVLVSGLLTLHWMIFYSSSYSYHEEIGMLFVNLGILASLALVWVMLVQTRGWKAMTRGMLTFATSATVLGLFHWFQFLSTPWPQESGKVSDGAVLWPAFIVLGLPALVCYFLYRIGREDAYQLELTGFEPGIVPDGHRVDDWEKNTEQYKEHPVELLSNKALLANPMVLGMVFGQLCDGFATMMGIDYFGYGEKHPVSNGVIGLGGQINDAIGISFGEGAWFFALVKASLVAAIVYLFSHMRIERRQAHLRLLIVLAVMIVGLAPGLRDIGRLTLGV